MELINKNSSVLFATFSPFNNSKRLPTNGNVDPMISFFVPKVKRFTLIDQPHTGSNIATPLVEKYENKKLQKKYFLTSPIVQPLYRLLESFKLTDDDTNIFFKIRDLLSVLYVGIIDPKDYNIGIGFESINTIALLFLKKIVRVKKVIYYVSDYSPTRYNNKVFNKIYLLLDRFCCYHADYIWDVSKAMHPARIKAGLNKEKSAPVIHVPNALFPSQIQHASDNDVIPYSLVFMGTLGFENGPDLAIEALVLLIKKIPQIKLHIIGKGDDDLNRLKKRAKKLDVTKYILFHGFIPNDTDMLGIVRKCQIGLAPYLTIGNSVRWYGDSLKLRAYMACGIPVITTKVPPLGKELSELGSAIIVYDTKEDLARAITYLIKNKKIYKEFRKKAIQYSKRNTWEKVYKQAFLQMK